MKKGVHIIECLDAEDPGSEGRCLKHLFNLLEVKSKYTLIQNINDLLEEMENSEYKYIHISTHGKLGKDEEFIGWWTHQGHSTKAKIASLKGKIKCRAIISTACKSGKKDFGTLFVNGLGVKYFIGPKRSTSFSSSIFFSHILYHKIFRTKFSLKGSFESYKKSYKNPYGFVLFKSIKP
jgi:hypothetical protein